MVYCIIIVIIVEFMKLPSKVHSSYHQLKYERESAKHIQNFWNVRAFWFRDSHPGGNLNQKTYVKDIMYN